MSVCVCESDGFFLLLSLSKTARVHTGEVGGEEESSALSMHARLREDRTRGARTREQQLATDNQPTSSQDVT